MTSKAFARAIQPAFLRDRKSSNEWSPNGTTLADSFRPENVRNVRNVRNVMCRKKIVDPKTATLPWSDSSLEARGRGRKKAEARSVLES